MKASGTAAKARDDRALGKVPPVKPAARVQAETIPAVVKQAARPVAARAAATAVATKSAPGGKQAAPAAPPSQPPSATAAEPVAAPAVRPSPTQAVTKQPANAKAMAGKAPAPTAPARLTPQAGTPAATLAPAPEASPATPARVETAAAAHPPPRPSAEAARRPGTPGMHTGPITAPRIPAKAEIFREGDHVVYPTHGVGKVERIATEEIAGHKLELIHITFEENRMTLRVPVAKARTAGLRKLATRKLFDDALNVLKGRARIKRTMWSRRAQEYEAKINSGDPLAIAEVVRDLHRNAGQPDQSFSERQIYEAAMERLAAELAALDKTDKATAATKLTDFLKTV